MDHPFRTAAFGGFHRQDVLTYLEEHNRQATQQREDLEGRLSQAAQREEELRREAEELRAQVGQLEQSLEALRQENTGLMERLEESNRELSASRTQCSQGARDLESAQVENQKLQQKLDELTPDAQAYTQLKDRTAGVELEAHRRAQAIQEQAESDAKKVRRQVEQWLQGVRREHEELCSRVESTVSHAAEELRKADACLEQAGAIMGEQDQALEAIIQAYAQQDHTKVEAPMPIEE